MVQDALNDVDADVLRATVQWIGRDELTQFRDELAKDLARKATTPELLTAYLAALAQLDGVIAALDKRKGRRLVDRAS